ncbi:flavin-binding family monooxygenase domain protein [Mycobacterium xenopi 3993]|nr:flavin-binding family monooxygenase domain protein [Mycobacterium xenopi 3993]
MTVTPQQAADSVGAPQDAGYFDVVIIGAGISGLGAAYRISERNPASAMSSWSGAHRSAAPGTCSATPVCARTAASSRCRSPTSRGPGKKVWPTACTFASTWPQPRASTASTATSGSTAMCAQQTGIRRPTPGRLPPNRTARPRRTGPVRVLRVRLLQLRRGLHSRIPRHRAVQRHRRAPAALARGPGLHRQEDGGDRQRGNGGVADPVTDREGLESDHAATFADLHVLGVQIQLVRGPVTESVAAQGGSPDHPDAQRTAGGAIWFLSRKTPAS